MARSKLEYKKSRYSAALEWELMGLSEGEDIVVESL